MGWPDPSAGMLVSPNARFAALSARMPVSRTLSELSEIEKYITEGDDVNLTAALDRRLRSIESMGMMKVDKVSLSDVPNYHQGNDIYKWIETLFVAIMPHLLQK